MISVITVASKKVLKDVALLLTIIKERLNFLLYEVDTMRIVIHDLLNNITKE